jgi:hypothetical protein
MVTTRSGLQLADKRRGQTSSLQIKEEVRPPAERYEKRSVLQMTDKRRGQTSSWQIREEASPPAGR